MHDCDHDACNATGDPEQDPFDTERLRAAVYQAWRASSARFREDANAEEDLRLGGYRDRLFVELAANAADAATSAGLPGEMAVTVVGGELRVANTGEPLTGDGVAALASLRASAKRRDDTAAPRDVGQFGVGFAAVLAVSDGPAVVSRTGGVRFSQRATRRTIADIAELREELDRRAGTVPVLRLAWPCAGEPPDGFSTEVRLPLRHEEDGASLLAQAAEQAPDLLLALPGLAALTVGDRRWWRETDDSGVVVHTPSAAVRWLVHRASGVLDESLLGGLGVEARQRPGFSVSWAVPLDEDGLPVPLDGDVLHAPTPTDEALSLPARLLATVPTEPARRRVRAGQASEAVLAAAATEYPALVAEVPARSRPALVPTPAFPRSEVDAILRERVLEALGRGAWLPSAEGGDISPAMACVLDIESEALVASLAPVIPGLLVASCSAPSHAPAMTALGVRRMRFGEVTEALAGIDRPPEWWYALYDAIAASGGIDREALAGLPVPLTDGRTALGPRTVLLASDELADLLDGIPGASLPVVDREAAHPMLERLGARRAGAGDALDSPELCEAVRRSVDDACSGIDTSALALTVLRLVAAIGTDVSERPWLAALALPDVHGERRRADELLLPDAVLLTVLDEGAIGEDAPLAVLDTAVECRRDALTAVGVLDSFALVVDDAPVGPDHDLPDERGWWEAVDGDRAPPARLVAVRDLDLVADDRWPEALRLLARQPNAWRALSDTAGYTGWWLARYALLAGRPPRQWRLSGAVTLAGLYDAVPDLGLERDVLTACGVREDLRVSGVQDAADLLDRLGDGDREVLAGTVLRAHAALAVAVSSGALDPSALDPPENVRTISGKAVAASEAYVLDAPWLVPVGSPERAVAAAPGADAAVVADLLDIPCASERLSVEVVTGGESVPWTEQAAVRAACALVGSAPPEGDIVVHDTLTVRDTPVAWWCDTAGVHAEDSSFGLAMALAWTLDRWADRHLLAALLEAPDAATVLG